jgi:hypothetical protein
MDSVLLRVLFQTMPLSRAKEAALSLWIMPG